MDPAWPFFKPLGRRLSKSDEKWWILVKTEVVKDPCSIDRILNFK